MSSSLVADTLVVATAYARSLAEFGAPHFVGRNGGLVLKVSSSAFSLVTDPFRRYDDCSLQEYVPYKLAPFKTHYVACARSRPQRVRPPSRSVLCASCAAFCRDRARRRPGPGA